MQEKEERYTPEEANSSGMKRIKKIDFTGRIYLEETSTNTKMILVEKGNFVISGINVQKGAMAIYTANEPVLASIHYSSYQYDHQLIDVGYLKWFLTSAKFKNLLHEQVGGGIKTEIKAKHLLPLEVILPDIEIQRSIVSRLEQIVSFLNKLKQENVTTEQLISKLRKSILQQAIEGKLVEQSPDDVPASVLLKSIVKEKKKLIEEKKIKKSKPLPPISEEEKPFPLPKGWEWCRLGDIVLNFRYGTSLPSSYSVEGVPVLRIPNLDTSNSSIDTKDMKYSLMSNHESKELLLEENDMLMIRSNGSSSLVGRVAIVSSEQSKQFCYAGYLVRLKFILQCTDVRYIVKVFNSSFVRTNIESSLRENTDVKNFSATKAANLLFPLPPLAEQERIVEKVDVLMTLCDKLEEEVATAKGYADQLLESVLQEAFTEQPREKISPFPAEPTQDVKMIARGGAMEEDVYQRLLKHAMEMVENNA